MRLSGLFLGGGFTQLGPQIVGILSVGGFIVLTSVIFWCIIKAIAGLRVPAEEEQRDGAEQRGDSAKGDSAGKVYGFGGCAHQGRRDNYLPDRGGGVQKGWRELDRWSS